MKILSGKALRQEKEEEILSSPKRNDLSFYLFSDPDNLDCFYYLKGIKRLLAKLQIPFREGFYDKKKSVEENLVLFQNGIKKSQVILARPLGIREENLFVQSIPSRQDPDSMSFENRGKLYSGDLSYLPATAQSVLSILEHYEIDLTGKKCLVIGRSNTVGLPLAELINKKNGLLTLAHSKVPSSLLEKEAEESEVIFLSTGHPGLLKRAAFSPKKTVIDCGFSKGGGDLGFIPEEGELLAYTPVPGGVGSLTSYELVLNALHLL